MECWTLLKLKEHVRWAENQLLAMLENSGFLSKDVHSLLDFSIGEYSIGRVFPNKGDNVEKACVWTL